MGRLEPRQAGTREQCQLFRGIDVPNGRTEVAEGHGAQVAVKYDRLLIVELV